MWFNFIIIVGDSFTHNRQGLVHSELHCASHGWIQSEAGAYAAVAMRPAVIHRAK